MKEIVVITGLLHLKETVMMLYLWKLVVMVAECLIISVSSVTPSVLWLNQLDL